jgi:aarF domain-containing kinase
MIKNKSSEDDAFISPAALRFVEGLDDLKGAAMKVGQLLSLLDENALPKGWKTALTRLQSEATSRSWEEMHPLLKKSLGSSLNQLDKIETEALHAASIGQVHRAHYIPSDTMVALKIRYPQVRESIKSDLNNLRRLFKLGAFINIRGDFEDVFKTVEKMLLQETDFLQEKSFYKIYFEFLKGKNEFQVPMIIDEMCTQDVLVTQWVEAESLEKWLATFPSLQKRDVISHHLLKILFLEIFQLKVIQTDPNPGNFLVTEDMRLVLLDFGAAQKISAKLVSQYKKLFLATMDNNISQIFQTAYEMGFLIENDTAQSHDLFYETVKLSLEPFFPEEYSWYKCGLVERVRKIAWKFTQSIHFRAPPKEVVWINRRLLGNQLMLENIGATASARQIIYNAIEG